MMTSLVQEIHQFLGKNIPGQLDAFIGRLSKNVDVELPVHQFDVRESVWKKCNLTYTHELCPS